MAERKSPREVTALIAAAVSGRVSRRAFMEGSIAFGVTIPTAMALWSKQVVAATPGKGGLFRVGLDDGNTTDTMDPATFTSRFMITMAHTHRNFLTEISSENGVIGELAESWDASPDARTWTLKLRKGVEFHNGKTFDAHDAAASLNYHRGEGSKSGAKALLALVDSIKPDDKYTLVIHLSDGNADIPYVLTDYHLVMLPADGEGKVNWDNLAGTGGYVVKTFEPGVHAMLERFANYWKAERAHFDGIEYTAIPDVNARQAALTSNSLDAMIECDFKTVDMLKDDPNLVIDEVPTGTHLSMPMRQDVAPFSAQIRHRSRSEREDRAQRAWLGRQRSADQPDHAVLQ